MRFSKGEIYWGPFAKDRSMHMAIIACFIEDEVILFPISSRVNTLRRWLQTDSRGVIVLEENEQKSIFNESSATSFIYCGKAGRQRCSKAEFEQMVKTGTAEKQCDIMEDLLIRVETAITESSTYSISDMKEMGF